MTCLHAYITLYPPMDGASGMCRTPPWESFKLGSFKMCLIDVVAYASSYVVYEAHTNFYKGFEKS